jgi:DNA-binding NarL/FixJ family response regulator
VRVLIADDYREWRCQVVDILRQWSNSTDIIEASDGLRAVHKAKKLKPDIILLDISLPMLNGIEAAKLIRQFSPDSRIIFLTVHNSFEVLQAAWSTGDLGYVTKIDVRSELLAALDAVLKGRQFVSSSLRPNAVLSAV